MLVADRAGAGVSTNLMLGGGGDNTSGRAVPVEVYRGGIDRRATDAAT